MADPTYKALLIGNSTFPLDSQNLQTLEGPVNDVAILRDALTDPAVGMLGATSVRMVPERTMSEILMEMEQFFGDARRDDFLILYYSGHGLLDAGNQLYLCARDTRTDLMRSTTVSASSVNAMIDGSACQTTIIMLDCCYSGAFKSGQMPDSLRGSGRFLLTSCRSGQLANDANQRNGTSMFTQHLVDGLVQGAVDTDGGGFVDLADLYGYVYGRLAAEGRQIPQRNFAGGGDVAIARRLTAPAVVVDDAPRAPERVLELSTESIDLRGIAAGDRLAPERVYVRSRTGAAVDWTVDTDADWLELRPQRGFFAVELHPGPGVSRANVTVHEITTGQTAVVRVRVAVDPAPPVVAPPPPPTPPPPTAWAPTPPSPSPTAWTPPPRLAGGGGRPATGRSIAIGAGALVALLVLVGVVAALAGGGGDGDGPADVTHVVVKGQGEDPSADLGPQWVGTGVYLDVGQTVTISAQGEVSHAPGDFVDPDGEADRPEILQYNILPDAPHAALIGRLDDGEPFLIGSSYQSDEIEVAGELYLDVNDVGHQNNGGEFQVAISVE